MRYYYVRDDAIDSHAHIVLPTPPGSKKSGASVTDPAHSKDHVVHQLDSSIVQQKLSYDWNPEAVGLKPFTESSAPAGAIRSCAISSLVDQVVIDFAHIETHHVLLVTSGLSGEAHLSVLGQVRVSELTIIVLVSSALKDFRERSCEFLFEFAVIS